MCLHLTVYCTLRQTGHPFVALKTFKLTLNHAILLSQSPDRLPMVPGLPIQSNAVWIRSDMSKSLMPLIQGFDCL